MVLLNLFCIYFVYNRPATFKGVQINFSFIENMY